MQGLFFETDSGVKYILRGLVLLIGFWTAWRAGKAVAENWQEYPVAVVYTLLLGFVMRFLHFSLFNGPFISPFYYVIDVVLLLVFSTIGFRMRRTAQMTEKYYWLYAKTSAFSWKKRD
jgi:CDP-diglyceride synthetase